MYFESIYLCTFYGIGSHGYRSWHVQNLRVRDPAKIKSRDGLLQRTFLLQEGPSFVLLRSPCDGMRPTHPMEGILLCSDSTT